MRKSIIVFAVLVIVIACSMANVFAIETCMKVEIVQISPDHDGMDVVVVVNEDGDSFMFSDIDWKVKIGQKMYMCIDLKYAKGNFWTMDEGTPFLAAKNPVNKKKGR
jgi:hypothetical protein